MEFLSSWQGLFLNKMLVILNTLSLYIRAFCTTTDACLPVRYIKSLKSSGTGNRE